MRIRVTLFIILGEWDIKLNNKKKKIPLWAVIYIVLFLTLLFNLIIINWFGQLNLGTNYAKQVKSDLSDFANAVNKKNYKDTDLILKDFPGNYSVEIIDTSKRTAIYSNVTTRNSKTLIKGWNIKEYFDGLINNKNKILITSDDEEYNAMNGIAFSQTDSYIILKPLSDTLYLIVQTPIMSPQYVLKISNAYSLLAFVAMQIINIFILLIFSKFVYHKSNEIRAGFEGFAKREYVRFKPSAIKELNTIYDSINKISDRLSKNDEAQKKFISDASHELKTPIAVISAAAEAIQMGIDPDNEKEYCDIILRECENTNELLITMIDLIKSEAMMKESAESEDCDISILINSELSHLEVLAKKRNLQVYNECIAGTTIYINPDAIKTIIRNLCTNAFKYCLSGGRVIIGCKGCDNNKVRIKIYNDCESISDEEISRIWDRFYKCDQSRNRETNSTGIGLAIVKALCISQKMEYGVQKVDGGIVFWIDCPAAQREK